MREESDSQRSTIVYEPGSFVPMLRIDDTQQGLQLSAFVTDVIGTPMQLVAANGEIQWQGQPDDWAAVRNERGNTDQPIRFQGQWHDEESGLYYNRHRYYDPQQGRYISQDPIGLQGGTNLYGYVTNPIGGVDPLGLSGYGLNSVGAAYGHAAREAHGRVINGQSPIPEREGIIPDDFLGNPADRVREGASLSAETGGQLVIGGGVSATSGVITNLDTGQMCTVHTICGMAGPRFGAGTIVNGSLATGTFEPGDVSWSIAGEGAWAVTKADLGVTNSGSVSMSAGSIFGADFGGALKICRSEISHTCWNNGDN